MSSCIIKSCQEENERVIISSMLIQDMIFYPCPKTTPIDIQLYSLQLIPLKLHWQKTWHSPEQDLALCCWKNKKGGISQQRDNEKILLCWFSLAWDSSVISLNVWGKSGVIWERQDLIDVPLLQSHVQSKLQMLQMLTSLNRGIYLDCLCQQVFLMGVYVIVSSYFSSDCRSPG